MKNFPRNYISTYQYAVLNNLPPELFESKEEIDEYLKARDNEFLMTGRIKIPVKWEDEGETEGNFVCH